MAFVCFLHDGTYAGMGLDFDRYVEGRVQLDLDTFALVRGVHTCVLVFYSDLI